MKKLVLSLMLFTASASAYADLTPDPTPEKRQMHDDAAIVGRILLNPQVNKCVKEIQTSELRIALNNVTEEKLTDGTTVYTFVATAASGNILQGVAAMTVTEKVERNNFGDFDVTYACQVSIPSKKK